MQKKALSAIILFFSFLSLINAQAPQAATLDVTENMSDSNKSVGSKADRRPDAQLAMSVSYYPVTAGDVYTLAFSAGSTPIQFTIPVDSTYQIRVANLGVINCAGLTYLQLKSQVESLVLKNYPMGGVQFVLTSPSVFLVSITGEVSTTVEQEAWALTRLSTFAGQYFTQYASTRKVTVKSAGGRVRTYDLFKAKRNGDLSQDPFLRPGDKIIANELDRKVTISGAVRRPGTYELLEGENLKELVEKYADGFAPLADSSRIELYRSITGEEGSGKKSYLNKSNIEENMPLVCYDNIYISSYNDLRPKIFVEGAIGSVSQDGKDEASTTNRIVANFNNGEDYAYFVRRNRGWFSAVSDLENAYIIRGTNRIEIDLAKMLYDASYYANVEMKADDVLCVPFKQYFVSVAGAVVNPGRYPYILDRDWEYYIGLAGGFTESNAHNAIELRDINGKKYSKKDAITPETTITAKRNSFFYNWNRYAPTITTVLSIVVSALSIYVTSQTL